MSQQQTITIPAKVGNRNGQFSTVAPGRVFACISSTAAFTVRADSGDKISARSGSAFGNPGARQFTRLTFYNTGAADNDVTFYSGEEDYRPNTPLDDAGIPVVLLPTAATPAQALKTVAAAGTPERLAAAETYFRTLTVLAYKTIALGANTGNVQIGMGAANNQQIFVLEPGDERTFKPGEVGQKWNLNDFYLDADTNGDGVILFYS